MLFVFIVPALVVCVIYIHEKKDRIYILSFLPIKPAGSFASLRSAQDGKAWIKPGRELLQLRRP